ncbi:hypothetical protein L873DRAFT_1800703 [Choiromyces venosus 120613-1]|uniref:Secreted protein n=1 Tax=Choiromyces venosus 120613-1 TaxID=1336337 RepID=A0A3N4K237_9PEZI|nr:hypothetical protein L873DRAFT_1800703 [Choiromyces venosus 120613-1]
MLFFFFFFFPAVMLDMPAFLPLILAQGYTPRVMVCDLLSTLEIPTVRTVLVLLRLNLASFSECSG